jgi:hypothetical protein
VLRMVGAVAAVPVIAGFVALTAATLVGRALLHTAISRRRAHVARNSIRRAESEVTRGRSGSVSLRDGKDAARHTRTRSAPNAL